MSEEVSNKNTKNEILDAYNDLLKKMKETKKLNKQEEKAREDKNEVVAVASKQTTSEIIKKLADLKLSLVNSLEELEEKLLAEQKKLTTLQQAIDIQTKEIADIYEIKVNADTLAVLLMTQKEKSIRFENEMKEKQLTLEQEITQKKLAWKKEQEELEIERQEYEEQIKKLRKREEDSYQYNRDLTRRKERDLYDNEKQSLEKELIERRVALEKDFETREAKIIEQEEEFKKLIDQSKKFPEELEQAILSTENRITEKLKFKFDYETQLTQKEIEGERKLYQQMITALEAKVTHLEAQVKLLSDKANQANLQVQDIAVKAIEGASHQRYFGFNEKTIETAK
jgi:hypothetical protein